jgi:cystathionine beta-lyase
VSKGEHHGVRGRAELFGIRSSWGGFESLIQVAYPGGRHHDWDPGGPTIRVHIGLEDPDDLIADLEAAFAAMKSVIRDW